MAAYDEERHANARVLATKSIREDSVLLIFTLVSEVMRASSAPADTPRPCLCLRKQQEGAGRQQAALDAP